MKKLFITAATFFLFSGLPAAAQCPAPPGHCECLTVTMPPDTTICPGTTYSHDFTPDILVPPGCTIDDWSWSSAASVMPSTGSWPATPGVASFTPTASTTYTLTLNAFGPNMINNGDFSMGTSCFTTAYLPYTGPPGAMVAAPGTYKVAPDINPYFSAFSFTDHSHTIPGTFAPYNMLMVDGSMTSNTLLWQETGIPVCADTKYEFSFWLANITSGNAANIRVVINGVTFGPFSASGLLSWERQSLLYTVPSGATTVDIQVYDDITYDNANDFAIDDIAFRHSCQLDASFTVNLAPAAITGPATVCAGSKIHLTGNAPGGTWSITSGATIDALGNVTGVTAGTATVTYTTPKGCVVTRPITVLTNPVKLTGPSSVCQGDIVALTGTPAGLNWSSTGPITPYGPPGVYSGSSPGTGIVTYTDPSTGCFATRGVVVYQIPRYMPDEYLCIGDRIKLTQVPTGGTWTSSNTSVATINATTGAVVAVAPGTTVITYTTVPGGCRSSMTIHVYNCGSGVIVGADGMCEGITYTLIGLPKGGTWTSSNPAVATIDPVTGVVTTIPGAGGGTVTFTYTVGSITISKTVVVSPPATACIKTKFDPITGYSFDFTTSCPGTADVYYKVYDYMGNVLGSGSGYTQTVTGGLANVTESTIASRPGCGAVYRVCVYGVYCGGCIWSADCCDSLNFAGFKQAPSSTLNPSGTAAFTVLPNPSNGTFTVAGELPGADASAEVKVELMDMLGKTVYKGKVAAVNGKVHQVISLDPGIAGGTYLVRLSGKDRQQVIRLVVNR